MEAASCRATSPGAATLTPANLPADARRERVGIHPLRPAHRRAGVEVLPGEGAPRPEQRAKGGVEGQPEVAGVLDRQDGEAVGRGEQALHDSDHLEIALADPEAGPGAKRTARRQLGADHDAPAVGRNQGPALGDREAGVVAVRRRHAEVHPQDQLLVHGEELGRPRVQRQHHLRLDGGDARDPAERLDGLAAQEAAGREPGARADARSRHRDLAQDEAVAAVDESADAVARARRAPRDRPSRRRCRRPRSRSPGARGAGERARPRGIPELTGAEPAVAEAAARSSGTIALPAPPPSP